MNPTSEHNNLINNRMEFFILMLMVVISPMMETFSGAVICQSARDPIAYANICIMGKSAGKVSVTNGRHSLKLPADKLTETIETDISRCNIRASHDFLITLKHLIGLRLGHLRFSAVMQGRNHYRKTSQANWENVSLDVRFSVDIMEENLISKMLCLNWHGYSICLTVSLSYTK